MPVLIRMAGCLIIDAIPVPASFANSHDISFEGLDRAMLYSCHVVDLRTLVPEDLE